MSPASASSLESALGTLLEAYGPPGRESGVRAALRRLLRGAGAFTEDATGNLHVHRPGSGPRLLVTAHMDAPGVIVTRVDGATGSGRLSILGGRRAPELVGAIARFEDGRRALIGWDRGGAKEGTEPDADALFLETGVDGTKKDPKRRSVGDVAALEDRPIRLGDLWSAVNLDNRAGCAAIVAALKKVRRHAHDLHAVFSAQSDLGARGATTGAFGVDPEIAVVVDVAHVGDAKDSSGFSVGKGPCVVLKEMGFLAHPEALEWVRKAARSARVPLQNLIRESEGSDARAVRATRFGVPTAVIAIPARRTGSAASLIHARDLAQTSELIAAVMAAAPTKRKGGRR
ncbi:MAG TPA: hypothetical protein VF363_09660 [Candidatus Eisenbacteria bacterium]